MIANLSLSEAGSVLAILTPLVAVPLGVITFSLRALRDQQFHGKRELTRRIEHAESSLRRLDGRVAANERDYATKEDWLRESMLARQNIERLSESFARFEATHTHNGTPVSVCEDTKGIRYYEGTD